MRRLLPIAALVAATLLPTAPALADRPATTSEGRYIKASIRNYLRNSSPTAVGPVRISRIRVSSASKRWAVAKVHTKALGSSLALMQRVNGGRGATRWGVNAIGMPPFDCAKTPAAVRTDLKLACV